jgi:hypothetical protein
VVIRDRIKELRRVRAGDLVPCPWNWREHPIEQREALQAVLAEVGYAGAALARELENGQLMLIDGHLRAELDLNQVIPVLVLDVTEEEAKKLIATFDAVGALAVTNEDAQRRLLNDLDAQEAGLRKLIADMLNELGPEESPDGKGAGDGQPDGPPDMELRPHEHYDYVIVLARTVYEWNRLVELFQLGEVQSVRMKKRVGIGRGVSALRLLEMFDALRKEKESGDQKARDPEPAASGEHAEDAGNAAQRDGVRGEVRAQRLPRRRAGKAANVP